MKTILAACLASGLLIALPAAADTRPVGCDAKRVELEKKLEEARASEHPNGRVRGLERALEAIREDCTGDGLLADAREELAEAESEVAEREADLVEARAKGDVRDVAKREAKLEEARQEQEEARKALEQLELDLATP